MRPSQHRNAMLGAALFLMLSGTIGCLQSSAPLVEWSRATSADIRRLGEFSLRDTVGWSIPEKGNPLAKPGIIKGRVADGRTRVSFGLPAW